MQIKGSIFLKNCHFFFYQKRVYKSIYNINMIIKCGIWQPVKFQSVLDFELDQNSNDFFLSYLWINVGSADSVQLLVFNHNFYLNSTLVCNTKL